MSIAGIFPRFVHTKKTSADAAQNLLEESKKPGWLRFLRILKAANKHQSSVDKFEQVKRSTEPTIKKDL